MRPVRSGPGSAPAGPVERLARAFRHAWLGLALCTACAHVHPLPERLRVADTAALLERMAAARAKVEAYVCDVRLAYSGREGQLRVVASLAARRPGRLRYEVRSPLGSTVQLFATNGTEVQRLDMQQERFVYGPARPENLDRLLGIAPLGWSAAAWVSLFFGELAIPASARLAYDDQGGVFVLTWSADTAGTVLRAEVDPETSRLGRATVRNPAGVQAELEVREREAHGLPKRLRIEARAAQVTVEATLVDIEVEPPTLGDERFVLDPPAGFLLERL